jgi:signal transduction histidine kinase
LTAAYGLRHQATNHIEPLGLGRISRVLRVAGLALFAYALLAGLVVNNGDFFPANWLNDSLSVRYLGIPVPVFRSITGLIIAFSFIRALEVFDLELDRLIEEMEIGRSVVAERERIGRELHDGAIQQVYTAGLIVESARKRVGEDSEAGQRLERAITTIDQAISSLRTYMHELRPGPTNLDFREGLQQQAADPRFTSLMNVELTLALTESPELNPLQISHVLAISGEALANAARHANARHVHISAQRDNGSLLLKVSDNGRGFNEATFKEGYGLRNMRDRARLLGGKLIIDTEEGKGTTVKLVVPWEDE